MAWPSSSARTKTWGTEILTAGDLDGQFDILHTYNNDQLNATTGHKHSGGTSDGPQIPLSTGISGILPVANGGTASSAAINTAGGVVVPTGAVNAASGAVVLNSSGYLTVSNPYVKVSERQNSGTNGGASVNGGWQTRVINTIDNDAASISSIGTNQVTLPSGTYWVKAVSVFNGSVGAYQLRLQNITGSATLLTGLIQGNGAGAIVNSYLAGQFTIAGSTAIALQYQCGSNVATNGLGIAGSFGTEVYSIMEFIKIV